MTDRSGPRFVIRTSGGVDTPIDSVEELQKSIEAGGVEPDAALYDASTGKWAPARTVPVFRFIVEELEQDGRLPDKLSGILDRADEEDSDEDPFDFTMDLVETDPLVATEDGEEEDEGEEGASSKGSGLDLGQGFPIPEREEDPAARRPTADPSDDPAAEPDDRTASEEEDEEEKWFTPAEEGGIALPDPRELALDEEAPAELWEGEGEENAKEKPPPPPEPRPRVRRGVVVGLLVLAAVVAAWLLSPLPRATEESFPTPVRVTPLVEPPPPPALPAGLTEEAEAVLDHLAEVFSRTGDSIRGELGLPGAPPSVWLSGVYLANAGDFGEVLTFWDGYIEFVEALQRRDREVYFAAVEEGLDELGAVGGVRNRLRAHFEERYRVREEYRQERYRHLGQTARAAIRLHEVLAQHQDSIVYSPAMGAGMSADPILEADIPEGPVRREVDLALDRVFLALDRSRGGGAPSRDGLRAELFGGFGDY